METLMSGPLASPDPARAVVRHLTATLAYRAAKVLRDVPSGFGAATFAAGVRSPARIVAHMADLIAWGVTLAHGQYVWKAEGSDDWDVEVERFFRNLAALDAALAEGRAILRLHRAAASGSPRRRADARRTARDAAGHGRGARAAGELRARGNRHRTGRARPGGAGAGIRR